MHKKYFGLLILICMSYNLYPQVNPRQYDENFMYTVFFDDFNGLDINRNDWSANSIFRGIGQLIDSSLTYNVDNGKLELTMAQIPGYNEYTDYVGQEFRTNEEFRYGSFECKATFANKYGSWPAFWSFHGPGCLNNEGPEIDFAEYFCPVANQANKMGHFIHHWICGGGGEVSTDYDDDKYVFLATTNIYKAVWTPDKIDFYIDNVHKNTYYNNGRIGFHISR